MVVLVLGIASRKKYMVCCVVRLGYKVSFSCLLEVSNSIGQY